MTATRNKPVAAYTLAIVGVALQLVATLVLAYIVFFLTTTVEPWRSYGIMEPWMTYHRAVHSLGYVWVSIWVGVIITVVGLGAYGAILMNSTDIESVRTGATLVLVASVIAFPTMWGFLIGSLLMFIGSLLGLTWQPSTS